MKSHLLTEARVLRRRGWSLADLSARLGVSKSTASLWTKDVILSELGLYRVKQKRDSDRLKGAEVLHSRKVARIEKATRQAQKLHETIPNDAITSLVVLAIMYHCEGAKSDNKICFTNSDPDLVRAFLVTLSKAFAIEACRLKIRMQLHDYHDEDEMRLFWSHATGLGTSQFSKTFWKQSMHTYTKAGYKGCVHITYTDTHVARVILSFAKKLIATYTLPTSL